jgi:glycerol-3-phosphate acyltransferase PlsY
MPYALIAAVLSWIIVLKVSRYVSLASIAAAVAIPITIVIESLLLDQWDWPVFGFGLFVCLLAIWKHRSNIGRLYRGEENRFTKKSASTQTP